MSNLQQINFYSDELKTQKLNYSSLMLVQLSILLFVVFAAATGFRVFQVEQQQSILTVKQQKQKVVMADLKVLQTAFAKLKKDGTLKKQINKKRWNWQINKK